MAKTITPIDTTTDTFNDWVVATNTVIDTIATEVLTANTNANGAFVTGNSQLFGIFTANTVAVYNTLRGGNVQSSADLSVGSNTTWAASMSIYPSSNTQSMGSTTGRWQVYGNTGNFTGTITTAGGTLESGGAYPSSNTLGNALGSLSRRWSLIANTGAFTGTVTVANGPIAMTDSYITIGNNSVTTAAYVAAINSTMQSTLAPGSITCGANVQLTPTYVRLGNTTLTGEVYISVSNTTSTVGLHPTYFAPTTNAAAFQVGLTTGRVLLNANTGNFSGLVTSNGGVVISKNDAELGSVNFQTAGSNRWVIAKENTAEGAGNTGSNFHIYRYGNTGTYIDNPMTIFRDSGNVNFNSSTVRFSSNVLMTDETAYLNIGDAAANVQANNETIKLQNSTVSWTISKPTAAQVSSGTYYLGSDGTWRLTSSGTVGVSGSPADNQVAIFTNGSTIEGVPNLQFDGTTLTVNGNILPTDNATSRSLGSTTARYNISANTITTGSGISPVSNTVGQDWGSTTARPNITANTVLTTGNIGVGSNVTLSSGGSILVGANTTHGTTIDDFGITIGGDGSSIPYLQLGNPSQPANTPYIDVHSSGESVDYDVRFLFGAGNTTAGSGNLTLYCNALNHNSNYVEVAGKKTIWVPAPAWFGGTTNAVLENHTFTGAYPVWKLDPSTPEYLYILMGMPKSWNESTISFIVYWVNAAGGSGNVVWKLEAGAYGDGDTLNNTFGATSVTDAAHAASVMSIAAESSAITVGGSPAENDLMRLTFFRDAASGSDTYASDSYLLGVKIMITTNLPNDT